MASLTEGLRLRFRLTNNVVPGEEAVFSMYTGKRDQSNYPALAAEMADFMDNIMADTAGVAEIVDGSVDSLTFFVDEWQNPVFSQDSWGNIYSLEAPGPDQAPNLMPASIAVAVTRQTQDQRVPQARSYNRSYLPYINAQNKTTGGYFSSSAGGQLLTALQTFHSSLQGVPLSSGVDTSLAGLCNVVYAGTPSTVVLGAEIFRSDLAWTDDKFDHQRSRIRQYRGSRTQVPLTPGGSTLGRFRVDPSAP